MNEDEYFGEDYDDYPEQEEDFEPDVPEYLEWQDLPWGGDQAFESDSFGFDAGN